MSRRWKLDRLHGPSFIAGAVLSGVIVMAGTVALLKGDAEHVGTLAAWIAAIGTTAALFAALALLWAEQRRGRSDLRLETRMDGADAVITARNFGGVDEVIFRLRFVADGMPHPADPYGVDDEHRLPPLQALISPRSALEWHVPEQLLRQTRLHDPSVRQIDRLSDQPLPMRAYVETGTGEATWAETTITLPPGARPD